MRRSLLVLQLSRLSVHHRDALQTAKRVERIRTRRMQARRSTTSEVNKMQYVSAFIEAFSAETMHKNLVEARFESALEHSLKDSSGDSPLLLSSSSSLTAPDSSFGSWHEAPLPLRKHVRSVDVMSHSVIREARTPPEWSLEGLGRALPLRTENMKRFMRYLDFLESRFGSEKSSRRNTIDVGMLFCRYERLLQELGISHSSGRMSRSGNSITVSAQSSSRFTSSVEALGVLERNLASYLLQHLTLRLGWRVALDFLKQLILDWSSKREESTLREDLSQQIAVFAEAVRYSNAMSLPSFDEIEDLLQKCKKEIDSKVLSSSSTKILPFPPVVAAPILSILEVNRSGSLKALVSDLQRLVETYLIHYQFSKGRRLRYLPAIAWGEYLHAFHRFGASLEEIQKLTDEITDSTITVGSEDLLRSPHVWRGYFACCGADHALDVYESNRTYYRVKETAALSAVLMERLLLLPHDKEDPSNSKRLEKASTLWKHLQRKKDSLVIGTSSVWVAVIRLHLATQEHVKLMKLSVDYESFLVYFSVDLKWWENEGGSELYENAEEIFSKHGTRPFRTFFEKTCTTYDFKVPPSVQNALRKAIGQIATSISTTSSSSKDNDFFTLSADDIASTMV